MNTPQIQLGLNVAKHRNALGFSQELLAEKSEVSRDYISHIEGGTRGPSIIVLSKIAKGLGVTISELCKGVEC